jgi:hypothetical protein
VRPIATLEEATRVSDAHKEEHSRKRKEKKDKKNRLQMEKEEGQMLMLERNWKGKERHAWLKQRRWRPEQISRTQAMARLKHLLGL